MGRARHSVRAILRRAEDCPPHPGLLRSPLGNGITCESKIQNLESEMDHSDFQKLRLIL